MFLGIDATGGLACTGSVRVLVVASMVVCFCSLDAGLWKPECEFDLRKKLRTFSDIFVVGLVGLVGGDRGALMVAFGLFGAGMGNGEAMTILSIVEDLTSSVIKVRNEEERESEVRV